MRLADRIVLTVYAVSLSIISFVFLVVSFGWDKPVTALVDSPWISTGRSVLGMLSGFLFLMGLRFVYIGIKGTGTCTGPRYRDGPSTHFAFSGEKFGQSCGFKNSRCQAREGCRHCG